MKGDDANTKPYEQRPIYLASQKAMENAEEHEVASENNSEQRRLIPPLFDITLLLNFVHSSLNHFVKYNPYITQKGCSYATNTPS